MDCEDAPAERDDYSHRYHAGNVGDVWKHAALAEWLTCARSGDLPIHYLETHAGEGGYPLDSTGEWTEGIGKLWAVSQDFRPNSLVSNYLAAVGHRGRFYHGSPMFAANVLGAGDRLTFWEKAQSAYDVLAQRFLPDSRVTVRLGDGVAGLVGDVTRAEQECPVVCVLVDPPYSTKSEWMSVPDALIAAVRATKSAQFALWYPLKSLTRPNAMIARFREAKVSGTVIEWTNTPLELKRHRLNGSGLVLIRVSEQLISRLLAGLPALAQCCATHDGRWSVRAVHW